MSLSQEGHVPQPGEKQNKMPTWLIIVIIAVIVLFVVVCCLVLFVATIASILYLIPQRYFFLPLGPMMLWL
jgi:hypothetical protein